MIYSVQQIKFEILAYIKEFGGDFSEWYVGIAADPKGTMFQTHKVHQDDDIWLHKQALTFTACKTIQKYFLDILKFTKKIVKNFSIRIKIMSHCPSLIALTY